MKRVFVVFLVFYLCDKFQRFGLRAHMYKQKHTHVYIQLVDAAFSSFEKTMKTSAHDQYQYYSLMVKQENLNDG